VFIFKGGKMGFVEQQADAWSQIRGLWEDSNLFATRPETPDGPLATVDSTAGLRDWLPAILAKYRVTSMLDAACGDWNWMRLVDLSDIRYTGWDVDQGRLEICVQRVLDGDYTGDPAKIALEFRLMNLLTVEKIPRVDLILCRHFLQHLPTNDLVQFVIVKFQMSGSRYLLTTTYPGADNTFEWDPFGSEHAWQGYFERPVDLEAPPFNLGPKLEAFTEAPAPAGVIKQSHELALFRLS
jgi:hypothetical protein